MKQLAVISGKGGTGKTSLVAAFASLAEGAVFADCDVDAADLHMILKPKVMEREQFHALKTAVINSWRCVRCGLCEINCRFNAIHDYNVSPLECEGCGVCELVCPHGAVKMKDKVAGESFISDTRFGPLAHARLNPGEEASGKLVTAVRNNARKEAEEKNRDLIIIDGSPGIGCPVIASIGGCDLALAVTEPTVAGVHDLERVLGVCKHFKVPALVCINKCDINEGKASEIEDYCVKHDIQFAGRIPYDQAFTRAQTKGKTIMEYALNGAAASVERIWSEVYDTLRQ